MLNQQNILQFSKIMAGLLLLPLLWFAVPHIVAQEAPSPVSEKKLPAPKDKQELLPVEIQNLVNDARGMPPEFAADILIRAAEADLVINLKWKRKLFLEAYELASNSPYPIRLSGLPGSLVDTRPGFTSRAFESSLDTLSLKSRAIRGLLKVDKKLARRMIEMLQIPELPALACEDALVYDYTAYYQTLSEVIDQSFSQTEKRNGGPLRLLETQINKIKSPQQMLLMIDLLLSQQLPASQLAFLLNALNPAIKQISVSDRDFSATSYALISRGFSRIAAAYQQRGESAQDFLREAKGFIMRHSQASRCADNVAVPTEAGKATSEADLFNRLLMDTNAKDRPIALISDDEKKPAKIAATAKIVSYWESNEARQLLYKVKRLRFGNGEKPLTVAYKVRHAEWGVELTSFLNDLSDWKPSSELSEQDYLNQKSTLYTSLLEIVPTNAYWTKVLEEYVAFLGNSGNAFERKLHWFLHLRDLIALSRASTNERRKKILSLLTISGYPLIRLYGLAESVIPDKDTKGLPTTTPSPSLSGNTTFELNDYLDADNVVLTGSFNNWNQTQYICGRQASGWVCRIDLQPGRYTYKFIVDDEWLIDPANPTTERDPQGNINSVIVVSPAKDKAP
jgi:hypothetical protein